MKLGIIGAGAIAETMAKTVNGMKEAECYAIASRSLNKAEEFKNKFGFQKAYGSYEDLVKDENVDLIYVAVPHSKHFECMKLCIENHKPVLCEKPFTVNAIEAREIKRLAKDNNVFVTEAIWTRYMPSRELINNTINSGIIGEVKFITGDLSYPITFKKRIMDPNLAGGALLDLGVYGLNFASMILGDDIENYSTSMQLTDTGVDANETITLMYPNNVMATVTHSILIRGSRKGIIAGDKGYIVIENINNPNSIKVYDTEDKLIKEIEIPNQITGYEYEVLESKKCIEEGKIESNSMPIDETIKIIELMDDIRKDWNLIYPFEK